jgi:hypothetical protein
VVDTVVRSLGGAIVRADVDPRRDEKTWRTCVQITVEFADGTTEEIEILADTEPLPDFSATEEEATY